MRTILGCVAAGVVVMAAFVIGRLSAQEGVASCRFCPSDYIPRSEIAEYEAIGRATNVIDQQMRSIEKEIASLMQQTPANLIQVKSKIQDAEKLRSELRYLRVEALENGKSVLSSQQRDQLKTLVRSQHEQFRGRRGQPS